MERPDHTVVSLDKRVFRVGSRTVFCSKISGDRSLSTPQRLNFTQSIRNSCTLRRDVSESDGPRHAQTQSISSPGSKSDSFL